MSKRHRPKQHRPKQHRPKPHRRRGKLKAWIANLYFLAMRFLRGPLWRTVKGALKRVRLAWRRLETLNRLLALGLVTFLIGMAILASTSQSTLPSQDLCELFERRPAWFVAAQESEQRWGVPIASQMAFIRHESGFQSDVRPPRRKILWIIPGPRASSAFGYSQALDSTWQEYQVRRKRPHARRTHFADAIDFVGWYGQELNRITGIPLDDTYQLYLAYHQGPQAYLTGGHHRKPDALDVASRVARTAKTYGNQLERCQSRLKRRQILFLILEVSWILAMLTGGVLYLRRRQKGS